MKLAVLLTNLGTPDSPNVKDVRKYLKEFLSDERVVDLPRWIWLPILYGIILPFRAIRSAKLYQKIWTPEGSPLKINLIKQQMALQDYFNQAFSSENNHITVYCAMRYGEPSLKKTLQKIREDKHDKLLLLPLYPQYSAATTASTFDKIAEIFKTLQVIPEFCMIRDYYNHPDYIELLSQKVKKNIDDTHPEKIIFSFHGLPQKFIDRQDLYYEQCHMTAKKIAEKLALPEDKWMVAFQSRFGKAKWIEPYLDKMLLQLAESGIKKISLICPGFSADCLETLEEINLQNRELFLAAGGIEYHYIHCLNDDPGHIQLLAKLIIFHYQSSRLV